MKRKFVFLALSVLVLSALLVMSNRPRNRLAGGKSPLATGQNGRITFVPQNDHVTMTVVGDLPKPATNAVRATPPVTAE